MAVINVLHPDDSTTHYHIGDSAPFKSWKITGHGLVIYYQNGNRKHILPGSMLSFDVEPDYDYK